MAESDPVLQRYLAALDQIVRPVRAADLPTTLEPMRDLLRRAGDPQAGFVSVAVAGSVGKGTTAHRLAARLPGAGLFTSPHLHSFRERFRTGDTLISREAFIEQVERLCRRLSNPDAHSTFELATALACQWFADRRVPLAVMEVGLGGRFDAVNAVPHVLALITPIEMEHAAMLGGTLERIAWHKAGIIPAGGFVLTVPQAEPVMRILQAEAARVDARLEVASFEDLPAAAADFLAQSGWVNADELTGREPLPLPGRLESVSLNGSLWMIDGSHTPLGAARLRDWLVNAGASRVDLIIGMLADKDAAAYLRELDHPGWRWVLTTLSAPRGLPAEKLRDAYMPQHAQVIVCEDVAAALQLAQTGDAEWIACCGSLRIAAQAREFLGLLGADMAQEARATRALFEGASYLARLR